ncbi:hypothetical protein AQUCO_02100212v1 [Aquilegia coerulea]|uniref:Bet v I/Major latex protein domain-containing protein n=1 Tax=Aquilegia coerulea TaxID=218851 RepID=A0A2G5DF92_AQUCA|nr:hypothetical protein AQUCO_02100212v1 [Aquilegia coerulea]
MLSSCDNYLAQSSSKCSSVLYQHIDAPVSLVWSILRRFEKPQAYKRFIKTCSMISGDGGIGSIRQVHMVSGFPTKISIERLDTLDDNLHVISFSIIGGDYFLSNYHSTIILGEKIDEPEKTIVMESYIVDVPACSTEEETCYFVNNVIKWNLESLTLVSEKMASCTS